MKYAIYLSRWLAAFTLVLSAHALAQAPAGWDCDADAWQNAVCDCGCGVVDIDCPDDSTFVTCETSACATGQVPWEHSPQNCMASACGDGWADAEREEACDDFEALAGGGCNADCSAVNDGYTCGSGAAGCMRSPVDDEDAGMPVVPDAAAEPIADTGAVEPDSELGPAQEPDQEPAATDDASGCVAAPLAPAQGIVGSLFMAALCLLSRARRPVVTARQR